MKFKVIFSTFLAVFLVACAVLPKQVGENDIGIRKVSLFDEQGVNLKDINWTAEPAGMSKKFNRSFENAPPFIPHDTDGMFPITKDMNMCVTCHMPEFAKDAGATPIPASHLYDIRNKKDKGGVLHDERFNCDTCHVPQANAEAPFKNSFKAHFRDANGHERSNLLDVLNDGVR